LLLESTFETTTLVSDGVFGTPETALVEGQELDSKSRNFLGDGLFTGLTTQETALEAQELNSRCRNFLRDGLDTGLFNVSETA